MKNELGTTVEPEVPSRPRKPYTAPAILFTTKVEARAVLCSKADGSCTLGPVSS